VVTPAPAELLANRLGRRPDVIARAPGRVNLIGEHTDYEGGLALPIAIDRETRVALARREDGRARAVSCQESGEVAFNPATPRRRGDWSDYVQGVVAALAERGIPVGGFDLAIASDVPPGAGLSSSAALQLAVATALDAAFGGGLDRVALARVAHAAERGFVGIACGILDPFASALGRSGHALRLDCASEATQYVSLPGARFRLLVAHSGVRRSLAENAYAERVAECRAARRAAATALGRPVARLRALAPGDLPELEAALEPGLLRRLRHVVTENARVDAMCGALRSGDLEAAGVVLREGQRSLRDDFEVSTAELDALCELGDAAAGVFGSRLTGAGFGGCTIHLVAPERAAAVAEVLAEGFALRFARRPPVWSVAAAEGAGVLPLPPTL
jgi:galactokinase